MYIYTFLIRQFRIENSRYRKSHCLWIGSKMCKAKTGAFATTYQQTQDAKSGFSSVCSVLRHCIIFSTIQSGTSRFQLLNLTIKPQDVQQSFQLICLLTQHFKYSSCNIEQLRSNRYTQVIQYLLKKVSRLLNMSSMEIFK